MKGTNCVPELIKTYLSFIIFEVLTVVLTLQSLGMWCHVVLWRGMNIWR